MLLAPPLFDLYDLEFIMLCVFCMFAYVSACTPSLDLYYLELILSCVFYIFCLCFCMAAAGRGTPGVSAVTFLEYFPSLRT